MTLRGTDGVDKGNCVSRQGENPQMRILQAVVSVFVRKLCYLLYTIFPEIAFDVAVPAPTPHLWIKES